MAKKKTTVTKKTPAAKVVTRKSFSRSAPRQRSEAEVVVRKFLGLQNVIHGQLNCKKPPHDPVELISYNNGYHERCIRAKVSATVGQGFEASPALLAHIKMPNPDYSMQALLKRTAYDFFTHGYQDVNVLRGNMTANIWHSPAINTRVKIADPKKPLEKSFVRFVYEQNTSTLAYIEEPEFTGDGANGVRQFNDLTRQGNLYYGEPDYISIKPLLRLNWSIVFGATRYFENSLMADTAIIEKGMGREDEEIEELQTYLAEHVTGVENSHKIIYLNVAPDEDIKFEKLSSDYPNKESTELRNTNRDEIIVAHGLFQRLIGVATAGALGGTNEVEGQFKVFKTLVADPAQQDIEEWWQSLFRDLGFPEWWSFKLKPIDIVTFTGMMAALTQGVQNGLFTPEQALREWEASKSTGGIIDKLVQLRKELVASGI